MGFLIASLPVFEDLILFCIVLLALISDLKDRKVPNALILFGTCIGFLLSISHYGGDSFISSITAAGIAIALFLPPVIYGLLGGGDVKLFFVIALFEGPISFLEIVLYSSVAGGLIVVGLILIDWVVKRFREPLFTKMLKEKQFPYVSAIFTGLSVALFQRYLG